MKVTIYGWSTSQDIWAAPGWVLGEAAEAGRHLV
jgi:hypothetical protein